ncbi:hypothetical protein Hthe01_03820 [Hydrogenophilus thermoluteolus]|uniref:RAMP superfamily CRISPR-associated protein n=1 Tax=Hydrogenophilus thermoluteolus TaxID=297 RepID=UPI0024A3511E|nr:RAMP superfamily CRISPR-associated protein [Hydrogenophilus thermoluteolus]GLW60033.1 hypothetical protein Hthe01_03820 [Hydrogenophilus thermoluteolus]
MMQTATFTLTFTTPAFLGDANQNARWRTPPIKHELRHWWRVAYAADHGFRVNVSEMRREEGLLFGHAWLENDAFVQDGRKTKTAARQSQVRIRLDHWNEGMLRQWPQDTTVTHPSVRMPIGSTLYLGYGPLTFNRNSSKTALKANAAIQEQEQATLAIAYPEATASLLEQALWLMDRFGTLGGRARNGWGSYHLLPSPSRRGNGGEDLPLRDWRECLKLDWPHAIGKDETGPLIWQTEPHEDWKSLMRTLAIVKIGLRTQFRYTTGRGAQQPEDRHWLSYPVTNHDVKNWNALRLPNQLRFKVRQTENRKLVGVIYHMPHLPTRAFNPDSAAIERVWRCVHQFLDELSKAPNVRDFRRDLCPRADRAALQKQAQQLESVCLQRIVE